MTKLSNNNHPPFDLLNDPATVADDLFAEVGMVMNAIKPNIVHRNLFASFVSNTNNLRDIMDEAKTSFRTLDAKTESTTHAVRLLTKSLPNPSPPTSIPNPAPVSSTTPSNDSTSLFDTVARIPSSPSRSSTPIPPLSLGSDLSTSSDYDAEQYKQQEYTYITRVVLCLCGQYFTPRKFILSTLLTLVLLLVVAFRHYDMTFARARARIV